MTPELHAWAGQRPAPRIRYIAGHIRYAMPQASRETRRKVGEDTVETPSSEADQVVVLIAEDEETIAETLAMIVEDFGYMPLVAHDGREALALAQQQQPDLIITDLMMPYLNGADLIAAVRDDAEEHGVAPPPIMVVTAVSLRRAEEAGADEVVAKPFNVATVGAMMQRLLSGHQSSFQ
jgi:CheY-like chemotaxis protein